jgi:hypothetical protein
MRVGRERILEQSDTSITNATARGDVRRLRGIPAVGRNVPGAISGTRPALFEPRGAQYREVQIRAGTGFELVRRPVDRKGAKTLRH